MQQVITWANVDPDLCRHMASLGHNELTDMTPMSSVIRPLPNPEIKALSLTKIDIFGGCRNMWTINACWFEIIQISTKTHILDENF